MYQRGHQVSVWSIGVCLGGIGEEAGQESGEGLWPLLYGMVVVERLEVFVWKYLLCLV